MRITTFKWHGLGVVSLVVALSVWSCICRPGSFGCRFLWLQMKRKLQVLSAIRLDVFVCKFPTSVRLGSSCLHILNTVLMTVSKTLGSFVSTTWRLILTDEFYSCVITVEFFLPQLNPLPTSTSLKTMYSWLLAWNPWRKPRILLFAQQDNRDVIHCSFKTKYLVYNFSDQPYIKNGTLWAGKEVSPISFESQPCGKDFDEDQHA